MNRLRMKGAKAIDSDKVFDVCLRSKSSKSGAVDLRLFKYTRKFTRRASKRCCVLFAAVWREPGVVCYHI